MGGFADHEIVKCSPVRIAIGAFNGALKDTPAHGEGAQHAHVTDFVEIRSAVGAVPSSGRCRSEKAIEAVDLRRTSPAAP